MPLSADYTFDQFVVGPSNRLAHAACGAASHQLGTLYNPLFVHGASGLGKTHLLQATCAEVLRANPKHVAMYVTCETFVNAFVRAIAAGQLHAFREAARQADLLVIDDVQFLASRESSQEELFHTFNVLYQAHKQIILSADKPPAEIPTLEDRLVSRFNWGLVTQIDAPNRETRHAILQKKARLRGVEVPNEVLDYIAEHVEANIRLLEGALTKLITEAQLTDKPLNISTARSVLTSYTHRDQRPLQISEILETVSKHFGIRLQDILGRKRTRSLSHPRQIAMYLARKLTPLSLEEIGMHFGGRDHSTVLHAERTVQNEARNDPDLAQTITQLSARLSTRA
jgi:chromosomal replication initiator protein